MNRNYHEIKLSELESFINKMKGEIYGCIWDTSKVPAQSEVCERLVRSECKVVISIGDQADVVHDTCDEIATLIEVIEKKKCDIDTRGSKKRDISLTEAIEEMEHTLFTEIDNLLQNVIIINKIG